jgi:hypothetical protein
MPIHTRLPAQKGPKEQELLRHLVEELKQPRDIGQPIILEDSTPETRSIRVTVVWDRWEDCPRELRAGIIVDAYNEAGGEDIGRQIKLALGITVPEAVTMGLLPWEVRPLNAAGQPLNRVDPEYRKAMTEMGAFQRFGRDRLDLRVATLEDAQATIERLQERLPGSKWMCASITVPPED